jgi:hypothetical protein
VKDLRDDDNRIPFAKYVALMKAGQDLCKDAAFALHFGESPQGRRVSSQSFPAARRAAGIAAADGLRTRPTSLTPLPTSS